MTLTRWLEIKRAIKLNNNLLAKKKGEEGYNPAYKFDFIYNCIVHNTNAITKYACLDLCGDETTWAHGGFGESGSGLMQRGLEKPGTTKGGQIVLVVDVDRVRPRAYLHHHKLHPSFFSVRGPNEVKMICDQLEELVIKNVDDDDSSSIDTGTVVQNKPKPIFRELPHITWDNYFSGDEIMDYCATKGFGITTTVRRDRLPAKVPTQYWHKQTTDSTARPKAARFEVPIFAVKRNQQRWGASVRQMTSFQSTSSCNIAHVNALNQISLFAQQKERGRALHKRLWAIEMNDSRQLYLRTYGKIDSLDHKIKNYNMFYRSWKYWHSPMIHGKAMAIVVAYDVYLECCEGKLNPDWKINKPVGFYAFCEKLAKQMLSYNPQERRYPGDEKFRVSTQQNQKQRNRSHSPSVHRSLSPARSVQSNTSSGVTEENLEETDASVRLCGFLDPLIEHRRSVCTLPNKASRICVVCGQRTSHCCSKCGKAMHIHPVGGVDDDVECFLHYHNTGFFGLARSDCRIIRKRQRDWSFPSPALLKQNSQDMKIVHNNHTNKLNNNNGESSDSTNGNNSGSSAEN